MLGRVFRRGFCDHSRLNEEVTQLLKERFKRKGKEENLMAIKFTCSYGGDCKRPDDRTSVKIFSKKSYEDGVVLLRCNCNHLHLFADNLGWFSDERLNIEDILEEKGEQVTKLENQSVVDIEPE
uniref:DNL-type domain-containing protein n=1 Tax=Mucochytrium quahogii TaxID=96639 RepID=A0A7S2WDA0_9STRA|mmetsp:Transcript_20424/g.33705  ORF Transcript_20424/g.33705 Transcript_20424/m.33705 type:complete len:124 (-) Transcript_20424:809-1180(-)|eukprot:CAMPEP_0203766440 /NCGR_PEP_ID=MMETSP0099_2-20121227/419_1 /ASSEMBLY_ACC=CAM_ASM_000209 /TAXON_ID=96639 /ORGANISM=" , Strain NY0313808BC1" /LENGTH=123 /DNA_ID=CAMNT_0050662791 /DNA_START=453 /DNA_END=824 /DNA_ORIENTATION=+